MIHRIIDFSVKNKFLVLLLVGAAAVAGAMSLRNMPLDAIPDLSDTQVIIYSRWDRSPDVVEAQITYPIVTALLGAPNVRAVRGFSDFGYSFVYVIFEDDTDIYWARTRTLEYLSGVLGLPCIQRRIETSEPMENRIKLGGVGYAWIFPLSRLGYHIGCGSLAGDPKAYLASLGWIENRGKTPLKKVLCACSGRVRLTGPRASQPFVAGDTSQGVWGVGESIGCVAPLAGDGVVPGMKSVQLLLQNWENPRAYTKSILKEFQWMETERQVIDKLLTKGGLGIKDAWVLKKNSRRMGMKVGVKEALLLLRALAKK